MPEGIRLYDRKAIISVDTVQVECGAGIGEAEAAEVRASE